jgi:ABC-type glutathione transport system ATPase component
VEIFTQSLAECGVGLNTLYLNASDLYAQGPTGPLFGRGFDLAQYAIGVNTLEPQCGWFTLEVKNLKTYFYTEDGVVRAVDGVDFSVYPGEVLGIVGESGCGKSVTSLSIMRLISIPGKIIEGEINFDGKNLVTASEEDMMQVRGNRISMIFQQPQSALNPVFRAGDQISEVLNIHQDFGKEAGREARS